MSLSNSSIQTRAGTGYGTAIATHTVNGKEHIMMLEANPLGHYARDAYTLYSGMGLANAANINAIVFFNKSASKVYRVKGLWIIPNTITITTAARISWDVNLISTEGSGGTAIVPRALDTSSPSLTVNTDYTAFRQQTVLPTVSYTLFQAFSWNDEINAANSLLAYQNQLPKIFDRSVEVTLRQNQGIGIKQTTDAVTEGTTAIYLYFEVE